MIYENSSELPAIEMKKLAIDYNEIYQKAMDDYISAITYGRKHAITASFVLPSLIEQGLSTNLQNRLLFKSICSLPDEINLSRPLDTEEQEYISAFLHNTRNFQFNASESYVMGKMYELFVREGVLKASAEMEMILTGVGHERQKKLTRTLNTLLKTNFARKEIRTEYLELMKDLFVKLNIRNSIMHRNKGNRRLAGNANQPIIINIDDVADVIDVRAEDEFARVELLVSLKQELERLSPRELMIIRTYLDYPIEVVARKLKVRPNTISKARRKIARELRKKLV